MAKAIYVGYLLTRESPTNIQRYVGLLEATLEAFPQLLISTFFITTVVAYNDNNLKSIHLFQYEHFFLRADIYLHFHFFGLK